MRILTWSVIGAAILAVASRLKKGNFQQVTKNISDKVNMQNAQQMMQPLQQMTQSFQQMNQSSQPIPQHNQQTNQSSQQTNLQ